MHGEPASVLKNPGPVTDAVRTIPRELVLVQDSPQYACHVQVHVHSMARLPIRPPLIVVRKTATLQEDLKVVRWSGSGDRIPLRDPFARFRRRESCELNPK